MASTDSDSTLVQRAQLGDKDAFALLFRRHQALHDRRRAASFKAMRVADVRTRSGEAVGCRGGAHAGAGLGEEKRMFVAPSRRGRGIARRIFAAARFIACIHP